MKALLAAALLVLALPATARAGTISSDGSKITYAASGTANDNVVVGVDSGRAFLRSDLAFTAGSRCHASDATHADCDGSAFLLQLLGGGDTVRTETPGTATLEVHGGAGNDDIEGTPNADALYGDADSDTIVAGDGNDIIDGGPGDDKLTDGAGNDIVVGGPGGDTWHAGPGTDIFTPAATAATRSTTETARRR